MLNKQIFLSLLLASTFSISIFAMEPDKNEALPLLPATSDINLLLLDAAQKGREHTIKDLLARNADVNAKDEKGFTALMVAATNGHDQICQLLIDNKADINERRSDNSGTALMGAVVKKFESTCKLLINNGADIAIECNGWTPIMYAAHKGHESICKLLIERGADIEAHQSNGRTLLIIAAYRGHKSLCELLINRGAKINTKSAGNLTALIHAAYHGHESICQLLLDHGAEIHGALEAATKKNQIAALKILITYPLFSPFKVPFATVKQLTQNGSLDPETTVAKIKANHFECIKPLMFEAMLEATSHEARDLLNPARIEQNFGEKIEEVIRERLDIIKSKNQ